MRRLLVGSGALLSVAAALVFFARAEIIDVLLRHGRFAAEDAARTASNLGYFCLCIVPLGLATILVRCICVLGAPRLYAASGLVAALVYLVAARRLVAPMGAEGLALASAIGSTSLCVLLLLSLFIKMRRRRIIRT